jgi:uncharacterized protein
MKVFIDTSAFYALCSSTDREHNDACICYQDLSKNGAILFTSNYVMLETVSLIQRRQGFEAAKNFQEVITENIKVLWVGKVQHLKAYELWREKEDRNLSFVDCTSFILMIEEGIKKSFCFDSHFVNKGFIALP